MTQARSTKEEGETEIHHLGYQFIVTLHCSETGEQLLAIWHRMKMSLNTGTSVAPREILAKWLNTVP